MRRARSSIVALTLAAVAVPAFALDLPALMGLLAQRKSGEATFVEERSVSGFEVPLRSSGRLAFAAPDRFERHTLEPREESMQVQGNTLVLKRGSRTRQMSLDAVPELAALVDAMRGTLNGDAATLQRQFKVEVGGSRERWTLALTPLDGRLAAQVRQLELAGSRGDVLSVVLQLAGGDRSLMTIQPLTIEPLAPPAAR